MSLQTAPKNKEVENVSTRVQNTKKEIELLKAELEKLIHSGTHLNKSAQNLENTKSKIVPETIIKHPEPASQPQPSTTKNVPQKKPQEAPKESSPKKTRNYNVAEAREYIKKQKEKRAEQLKAQIQVSDNKLDLKRQKLKELHKKTLELVNKNVQLKRERSKSRTRVEPLKPDKADPRQKSSERCNKVLQENLNKFNLKSKSQERLNNKENVNKPRTNLALKAPERAKSISRERAKPSSPKLRSKSQEKITVDKGTKPGSSPRNNENVANERASRARTRKPVEIVKPKPPAPDPIGVPTVNTNLLYPPEINLQKSVFPIQEYDDLNENQKDLNKRITIRPKVVSEHSIMTDACRKDSKETQTSKETNFEEPIWLQPPPALPYPYNFINTVKRKLQHAIHSPKSCVDVGVQNSEEPLSTTPEPEMAKSKEEIREMLIKSAASDLKSFASHKCPNLDLKVVENLELVPNSINKKSNLENVSKNIFVDYDSESDTSKNIPEISSESLVSSQREPKLNLGRLKDLKLQPLRLTSPVLTSNSNVKTDSIGYPEWKNDTYSSDFFKESKDSKSRGPKSGNSSTIKTITSEKKYTDIPIPSTSSINTNIDSNRTSLKNSFSTIMTENYSNAEVNNDKSSVGTTLTDNSSVKLNENFVVHKSSSQEDLTFKSLLTEGKISKSTLESDTLKTVSIASSSKKVQEMTLKEPTVSLKYKKEDSNLDLAKSKMKNITIRPSISSNNNINEIHLKFEAEVRLLNDFNESLRQFMNVEKAFENLKNKNDVTKIFQNVDTQTSVIAKTSTPPVNSPKNPSINYSRGSDVVDEFNDSVLSNNKNRNLSTSLQSSTTFSTELELDNLNGSANSSISVVDDEKLKFSVSNSFNVKNCAGLSLNMFEQLIKDEDARIQHLKAIIKIREQALLDRTKGELVWLEIQKKQLIETGRIEEASLLKKKQRGIILKHEQERNEIKKLKQMQKEASEERKNILKQQRNLIKSQLSTKNMLSKIKVKTPKERRSSFGPLRVVQSCSESIHSETSISRKSSAMEDVLSVTSHSIRVSEIESELEFDNKAKMPVSNAKRQLYMREAALQKRRKAAEELLRWHRKLLDEEKKIAELEAAATSVIKRMPKAPSPLQQQDKYRFNGKQLNQLWRNMTGRDDRKFVEDKVYVMSQVALERLCKSARQSKGSGSGSRKQQQAKIGTSSEQNYSSIFDPESVQEMISSQDEKTKISSSISELIDNFSRIEDEISLISRKSEQDITSLKEVASDVVEESIEDLEASKSSSSHSSVRETSVLKNVISNNHVSEIEDEIGTVKSDEVTNRNDDVNIPVEEINEKATEIEKTVTTESKDTFTSSPQDTSEEKIEEIIREEENFPEEQIVTESGSTKESTVATEDKEIVEEENVTTELSSEQHIITEGDDLKRGSIVVTEETEKSSEQHIITVGDDLKRGSTVVTEETEESLVVETERFPEDQITTESEDIKSSSAVETEEIEPAVDEESKSETKHEAIVTTQETEAIVTEEEKMVTIVKSSAEQEATKDSLSKSETIETIESSTPSLNLAKESLTLDEALECASKIEESLMNLNKQLIDQNEDEEIEEISHKCTESRDEEIQTERSSGEESKIEETSQKLEKSKNEQVTDQIPTEDVSSITKDLPSLQETLHSEVTSRSDSKSNSGSSEISEKTPPKKISNQIDVKKRVSEILADANAPRGDKSPRLQDLYITAYDIGSSNSLEFIEDSRQLPTDIFGSEAEELWKKQLAIEQEIKQLEQQQKEQLPYVFMREIPNKPPPPYTPPSSQCSLPQSVVPSDVKQINAVSDYSSKVLYKAYLNNTLDKVKFSENGFKLFSKVHVPKMCAEFIFNICKDIAREHYKQFEKVEEPSWLMLAKKPQLAKTKPLDAAGLDRLTNNKLKELFGFKKAQVTESAIIKWGRKKRDHVDEILVTESQEEESQWTNFDTDELIVKDQITADLIKMLIDETASVFSKIFVKKKIVVG